MKALFGNDGRIQQIFVQQGLGYGLDEEATRAAQRIDFTPGHLQGKPVSIWAGVTFRFQLKDAAPPERKVEPKQIAATRIEKP